MAKRWSFHIQQNLTPERLRVILRGGIQDTKEIEAVASKCGLGVAALEKVVLPFARNLGLLEKKSGLLSTNLGIQFDQLVQRYPALFPEAVHHLLYTAHHFDVDKRFSWAYAQVVDAFWISKEQRLDGGSMARLVGMVVEEAAQEFGIPMQRIAFSRDSVRGVLNWLRALDLPVVTREGASETFRRRYFCPVATMLWAVDFLYRYDNTAYGVRMFITPERIEQLCTLCILDPSGLDNVLMMAKRTSDYDRGGVFDYGTEGGFGRWLLLVSPCAVPNLVE